MPSVTCSACGTELMADDEAQLIEDLQDHAREHHDMEMPESKAKEAVEQGKT